MKCQYGAEMFAGGGDPEKARVLALVLEFISTNLWKACGAEFMSGSATPLCWPSSALLGCRVIADTTFRDVTLYKYEPYWN